MNRRTGPRLLPWPLAQRPERARRLSVALLSTARRHAEGYTSTATFRRHTVALWQRARTEMLTVDVLSAMSAMTTASSTDLAVQRLVLGVLDRMSGRAWQQRGVLFEEVRA